MNVGNKVKLIKGNPFGKIGIIKSVTKMTRPTIVEGIDLDKIPLEEYFEVEADDGTIFWGWEDDLELIE